MSFSRIWESIKFRSSEVPSVETDTDGYLIALTDCLTGTSDVSVHVDGGGMGRRVMEEEGVDTVSKRVGQGRFPASWRSTYDQTDARGEDDSPRYGDEQSFVRRSPEHIKSVSHQRE